MFISIMNQLPFNITENRTVFRGKYNNQLVWNYLASGESFRLVSSCCYTITYRIYNVRHMLSVAVHMMMIDGKWQGSNDLQNNQRSNFTMGNVGRATVTCMLSVGGTFYNYRYCKVAKTIEQPLEKTFLGIRLAEL